MGYGTIRERADAVGTLRFISVYLMETMARWVPDTPELEAKILLGRHIWEMAQHADELGKRTHELRAPLHYTARPTEGFVKTLETLGALADTAERVEGLYEAFLPDLAGRYRDYVEQTNAMQDEPTVRVIERILADLARMHGDYRRFREQRADIRPGAADWKRRFDSIAASPNEFIDFRAKTPRTTERV